MPVFIVYFVFLFTDLQEVNIIICAFFLRSSKFLFELVLFMLFNLLESNRFAESVLTEPIVTSCMIIA